MPRRATELLLAGELRPGSSVRHDRLVVARRCGPRPSRAPVRVTLPVVLEERRRRVCRRSACARQIFMRAPCVSTRQHPSTPTASAAIEHVDSGNVLNFPSRPSSRRGSTPQSNKSDQRETGGPHGVLHRVHDLVEAIRDAIYIYFVTVGLARRDRAGGEGHVRATTLPSCYIRPIAYYGYGEMGLNTLPCEVDVAISCWPSRRPSAPKPTLTKGVRVDLRRGQRHDHNTMPPLYPNNRATT